MATDLAQADWFRLRTVDIAQLDELRETLNDFARRAIDALVIRNVYTADYMQEISRRIELHDPPFYIFPPFGPPEEVRKYTHLYGVTLVATNPKLIEYFKAAKSFREHCRELFRDGDDFEERMRFIFSVLSGGRPVVLPQTKDEQIYMPATIRILPEGSTIDLHCDNNLSHHPNYDHLRTLCDVDNQLSYFVTINTPEEGGELVIYRRRWSADDDTANQYDMRKDDSMVEDSEYFSVKPEPGDLILHSGGRAYHRVTASIGPRTRHTIGGFVANALDSNTLFYFS